ncbi:hypothetical protein [Veillonella sp. VA139]|uniref:hypothetical protein n=1 Tax=Veillonella sp. VA139 TaxID=741830 RepID=UPI000F8F37D1|nr:hypothetical protein [Veillonella sp. VA139]
MSVQSKISEIIDDALVVINNQSSTYEDLRYFEGLLSGLILTTRNKQVLKNLKEVLHLIDIELGQGGIFE